MEPFFMLRGLRKNQFYWSAIFLRRVLIISVIFYTPPSSSWAQNILVDRLLVRLKNPKPAIRYDASILLGEIGGPDVVPALMSTLKDRDGCVRSAAASALGVTKDNRAVNPLQRLLKDSASEVRLNALFSLAVLRDKSAVVPIIELINPDNRKEVDATFRKKTCPW